MQPGVITIDGPAASGKSTIAAILAGKLNFLYLDTGVMYRTVTLAAIEGGIDLTDEAAVAKIARKIDVTIIPATTETDGRQYTVLLNEEDVTWDIRSPLVDATVSLISSYPTVRQEMVKRQREIGKRGRVIMVGRDIGTVVMPDAPLKLYITASAGERARRRWHDRRDQGHTNDFEAILADVNRRDQIDSSRRVSPLRPAQDAVVIDSTGRSVEDIVEQIMDLINEQVVHDN